MSFLKRGESLLRVQIWRNIFFYEIKLLVTTKSHKNVIVILPQSAVVVTVILNNVNYKYNYPNETAMHMHYAEIAYTS